MSGCRFQTRNLLFEGTVVPLREAKALRMLDISQDLQGEEAAFTQRIGAEKALGRAL